MVIGGTDHVIGSKSMKIGQLVQKHSELKKPVRVELTRSGDTVRIVAKALGGPRDCVVQIVTFIPKAKVNIRRGENAGKTIVYYNTVQTLDHIDTWNGLSEFGASVRVPAGTPVAVLVQERGAGAILGAAQLR